MSDTVNKIVKLAEEMIEIERKIEQLKSELKTRQTQFEQISSDELPSMMADIGLSRFALSNGITLAIKPVLILQRPAKDRMDIADQWLTENGYAGMVSTVIDITLGKGSERLPEVKQALEKLHIPHIIKKDINYQTLNAWGKEMESNNMVIPEHIFSVFRSRKTVIE